MVRLNSLWMRLQSGALLLAFVAGGAVEPMAGLARDGIVHHESAAQAGVHSATAQAGEHGHEDGGTLSSDQEHEPGHDHGTSRDHCTHAHGNALAQSVRFGWAIRIQSTLAPSVPTASSALMTHVPPPPRA